MNYQLYEEDGIQANQNEMLTLDQVKKKIDQFYKFEIGTIEPTKISLQGTTEDWLCNIEGSTSEIEDLVIFLYAERFVRWKPLTNIPYKGHKFKNKSTQKTFVVATLDQYTFPLTMVDEDFNVISITRNSFYDNFERVP